MMRWKKDELKGWGGAMVLKAELARPERHAALADILKETPCPAIGARRSYGDANLAERAIDMTRLDRFISFDADSGLLEAEAGITIVDILNTFAPKGWMPAVMPGTGIATLGGCIANDVHGKNHQLAGSFGQHVESLVLMGADGKSQRISQKSKPKLFRATLGGLGQTGVIVSARLHLAKCPAGSMVVHERRMEDLDAFLDAFNASRADFQVGWLDMTAKDIHLGRGILEEAHFSHDRYIKPKKARSVPFNAPSFAMSKPMVKAFNWLYYKRIPEDGRDVERPLHKFFFPLDGMRHWNRLYGKRGFHQFQCVLPDEEAAATLALMLEAVVASGLASPLSVLKRLGHGRGGMMSFPMEGFTLAVDIVNKPSAKALLARLNELARNAGGRVYLAKDSSLEAGYLPAMYPELEDFRSETAKADPARAFETALTKRLNVRGAS
jgi:decaprenylphospho-beta-D-ribofuranose 2-oxidase